MAAAMDDFLSWDPWEGERNGEEWSAVPTTLPTYVDAPRATRVRRPIERDRDWSGEAMVEVARTMRRPLFLSMACAASGSLARSSS